MENFLPRTPGHEIDGDIVAAPHEVKPNPPPQTAKLTNVVMVRAARAHGRARSVVQSWVPPPPPVRGTSELRPLGSRRPGTGG